MREQEILDRMNMKGRDVEWSTQDIADGIGVSGNTARKWLLRMVASGKITVRRYHYGKYNSMYLWKLN